MDVKSAFLNDILDEEVYIEQPKGFVGLNKKDMVYKLHKVLYGLKQAPRAWYERLHNYLIQIDFQRTNDNNSLYIKQGPDKKIVLAEFFVDDTLFIGNDDQCKEFSENMNQKFEVSTLVRLSSLLVFRFNRERMVSTSLSLSISRRYSKILVWKIVHQLELPCVLD